MEAITSSQLITVNTLVSKLHLSKEQKGIIIAGFTGGRSSSSKDLTSAEGIEVIRHLKSMDPDEKKADKMRRKLISMAHELHWHKPGTAIIDMRKVDGWCKKFGYLKKGLNSYTLAELPKLVTQFELGPYGAFYKNRL